MAEDTGPALPEVSGSGDTGPWSVVGKLGGPWERPTGATVSCRSGQEGLGKAGRLGRERRAHVQIPPLAWCCG